MIQHRSILNSADNTGAQKLMCIRVHGGYKKRYAHLGEVITVVVKKALPHSMVKRGEIYKAIIVRAKKEFRRPDGSYIRFDDNVVVIVDPKTKEPKGTRIFGPVARELRECGFTKIISLAPEVL